MNRCLYLPADVYSSSTYFGVYLGTTHTIKGSSRRKARRFIPETVLLTVWGNASNYRIGYRTKSVECLQCTLNAMISRCANWLGRQRIQSHQITAMDVSIIKNRRPLYLKDDDYRWNAFSRVQFFCDPNAKNCMYACEIIEDAYCKEHYDAAFTCTTK